MVTMYYDKDCNLKMLESKTVAVIGYGSQGHAHALNLRDSGVRVLVGLRGDSPRKSEAEKAGFTVLSAADASAKADIVMMLTPDEVTPEIYNAGIKASMKKGKILAFAHGYNIHFNQIELPADVDVIMIAPKGPGHTVRSQFVEGRGVPSLVCIAQDASGQARDFALAYACAIGSGRAGILESTFKEETETDLFGEQAVLCGGVTELMKAGFDTLVEAGYSPEMAYFECVHEMKLIVDLINSGGVAFMRYSISNTAEYGDYASGKRIITEETRKEMKKILREIQDGTFAGKWNTENRSAGRANFLAMRRLEAAHPVETVGSKLRGLMSWLKK